MSTETSFYQAQSSNAGVQPHTTARACSENAGRASMPSAIEQGCWCCTAHSQRLSHRFQHCAEAGWTTLRICRNPSDKQNLSESHAQGAMPRVAHPLEKKKKKEERERERNANGAIASYEKPQELTAHGLERRKEKKSPSYAHIAKPSHLSYVPGSSKPPYPISSERVWRGFGSKAVSEVCRGRSCQVETICFCCSEIS